MQENPKPFKIGLLECDHVLDELRYIAGDYREMFPAFLPDFQFQFYDVINGQFPASVEDCDAYICTGSRHSVYEEIDWILQLKQFIRDIYQSNKKFVGVCFGHQLLGDALGGKVWKSEKGWCVGVHQFEVLSQKIWMQPSLNNYQILMMCQDQVQVLPPNSEVLATSEACKIAMFQVGNNMLGIQGHPEFSKEYDQALMELRVERIGKEKVIQGIDSLKLPLDASVISQWISKFINMRK